MTGFRARKVADGMLDTVRRDAAKPRPMEAIRPRLGIFGAAMAAALLCACARVPPSAHRGDELASPPSEATHVESSDSDPVNAWPGLLAGRDGLGENTLPVMEVAGVAVSKAEYDAGLAEFRRSNPDVADSKAEWDIRLREQLLALAWLRHRLEGDPDFAGDDARAQLRQRLADMVVEQETRGDAEPTEQEVVARYERDRALYAQEPRVAVSMILVPTEQEAEAANRRLAAGESFATVASEMSTHSSGAAGGEIEPFVRGTYNTALEDLAFSLQPRQRGTVATPRGVFIIEKIAEIRGSVTPLEQVRGRIEAELRREKSAAARKDFLARVEKDLGAAAAP